ncbi:MAG: sugar phosphate isomerase/epimerase family protein [Planctomycetaceae bacterium]
MKFAICQELFENWGWERQCETIASIGYTGVEVAPFTLAPRPADVTADQRRKLRETAGEHGLEIIGLHWLLAKTRGLHLTTADSSQRRAAADYLKELADLCGDLGGTVMVFGSPGQRNMQPGVTREQAYANAAEVFRSAMPTLADRGVALCMEPLTTRETDFCNTCAEAVELGKLVDHPNFVLHQDVKAMLGEGTPLPQLIRDFKDVTRHFHVNDSNLLGPGMGETDYHPIFAALQETGYDGWVSVEVFDYTPGAEHIARVSLEYMRRVLSELATHH